MTVELELINQQWNEESFHIIKFKNSTIVFKDIIYGMIANATPTTQSGRKRLQEWKRKIAIQVKSSRISHLDPNSVYTVSIGMKFHPLTHGKQKLDLDNYSKPILDAITAGLFSKDSEDLSLLKTYNQFDDSNFRHIFLEHLPDANSSENEFVAIFVSQNTNK